MRRNLLVVCAGDRSLHRAWFGKERTYDILTIYFGDDPAVAEEYRTQSDLFFRHKGLKIALAREVLLEQGYFARNFPFERYAHVWFPDDDIAFTHGAREIERLFAVAGEVRADVFQPAIANDNYSKAWEATRLDAQCAVRRTNVVEIMAFGFSGIAFAKCFLAAVHILEYLKAGWGVEPVIQKCGEAFFRRSLRTFVIDAVPIDHTRPVGAGIPITHQLGVYEAQYAPQIFTNRMRVIKSYRTIEEAAADRTDEIHVPKDLIEQFHAERFEKFRTVALKAKPPAEAQ